MKRRNEQSIGEILREYLKMTQVENVVYEERIAAAWHDLLGEAVASQTERIRLADGRLYVSLRSAALRSELMMQRTALRRAVNERLGTDVVREVVVR